MNIQTYIYCMLHEDSNTHHEGVRLRGQGSILGAADADAELDRTARRVREESLGHVAHDPADRRRVSHMISHMICHMICHMFTPTYEHTLTSQR